MDAARFLGKARADIVAIGFDLTAQFQQRRPHLRRRDRRLPLAGAADVRRHDGLLDPRIAAMRASDLAGLLLRLETLAVAEPRFEFVAGSASQREQDHRADLLTVLCIPLPAS